MRRRAGQRGTIYVLVLGITTLLVAMGLAGSMLARISVERTNLGEDQAKARLLAVSYLDYCHSRIDGYTLWRGTVSQNVWDTPEAFADGSAERMYIDEIDGDITNDNDQPFRLYVRVTVGNAVRAYSQEFIPGESDKLIRDPKSLRQESAD